MAYIAALLDMVLTDVKNLFADRLFADKNPALRSQIFPLAFVPSHSTV